MMDPTLLDKALERRDAVVRANAYRDIAMTLYEVIAESPDMQDETRRVLTALAKALSGKS